MSGNFLKYFRVIFLFALAFALFHSLNQSKTEEFVIISSDKSSEEVIEDFLNEGLIKKGLTYYFLKTYITLGGSIEPGGYNLREGMGAAAAALGLKDPEYRFISVSSGQRKGEIADSLGDILDWDDEKVKQFSTQYAVCELIGQEGYFATGKYLIHKDEEPEIVQIKMQESFNEQINNLELEEGDFDKNTIIKIASLIQREAAGKNDMRLISGIIWNRLEIGMPLQIDATLQYIRGEEGDWWPVPESDDKYLDSEFNTYKNNGLPPAPISVPSENALYAAVNPLKTDCLFYLHDDWRNIHCSTTYEGHKRNVNYYLK